MVEVFPASSVTAGEIETAVAETWSPIFMLTVEMFCAGRISGFPTAVVVAVFMVSGEVTKSFSAAEPSGCTSPPSESVLSVCTETVTELIFSSGFGTRSVSMWITSWACWSLPQRQPKAKTRLNFRSCTKWPSSLSTSKRNVFRIPN